MTQIRLQSKPAVWEQNDLHIPSACGGVVIAARFQAALMQFPNPDPVLCCDFGRRATLRTATLV